MNAMTDDTRENAVLRQKIVALERQVEELRARVLETQQKENNNLRNNSNKNHSNNSNNSNNNNNSHRFNSYFLHSPQFLFAGLMLRPVA